MPEYKELTLECGVTITVSSDGKIFKDGIECKQYCYPSGYWGVTFKSYEHYLVHRLVASAFIQPLKRGDRSIQVHHINENKDDNRVENLKIMTVKEHQHLHKQIYPTEKACIVCGKMFIPHKTKRKRNQTCSFECAKKLMKQKAIRRKINQYSIDGEFIKTWDSELDIEKALNAFGSNIVKCCKGKIRTYKGFVWKYAD